MEDNKIHMVIQLAFCSENDAKNALLKFNGDVVDAVDSLIATSKTVDAPKEKSISEEQAFFVNLRKITDDINLSVMKGFERPTSSDQYDSVVSIDLPCLPEEKVPQNNCSQECLPHVPQSEVQTQETACQLPSQYSCD